MKMIVHQNQVYLGVQFCIAIENQCMSFTSRPIKNLKVHVIISLDAEKSFENM